MRVHSVAEMERKTNLVPVLGTALNALALKAEIRTSAAEVNLTIVADYIGFCFE